MTVSGIVPVILSGGAGSRLWPASRSRAPKQLLALLGNRTMFSMTVERTGAIAGSGPPLVVCNEEQRTGIQRELANLGHHDAQLILEPMGRNTAPATAVAALHVIDEGSDPVLFVMPADHVIRNEAVFAESVELAAGFADEGYLLTFGVDPTGPETGYGYIRFGARLADGIRNVESFREKPDAATAEDYVTSGRYLWNSGMFMFRASRLLAELETYAPDVLAAARLALRGATYEGSVTRLDAAAFGTSPSISIDYAVMERTESAAVVPIHTGWSDVGSWSALWELGQHDRNGNVVAGDVELVDVRGSYVKSSGRLVAAIGLDNVVIVDTADATLVSRRDRSQDVKTIVDRLQAANRSEVDTDGTESHPWGSFSLLATGAGYQVRRLLIDPGSETPGDTTDDEEIRWIVVAGGAQCVLGGVRHTLGCGESVVVAPHTDYQLGNASATEPLELLEISVSSPEGTEATEGDAG